MAAAPLPGHLDRGVSAPGSMEHLDDLGKLEEAHWEGDVIAGDTDRDTLAVPSGEELLQRAAYIVAETDSLGHPCGRQAVGQHAPLDRFASGGDQVGGELNTLQSRSAGADVTEHEPEHRHAAHVDTETVTPIGDVVAEPGRDLGCVRDAADPSESAHALQRATLLAFETKGVSDPRA